MGGWLGVWEGVGLGMMTSYATDDAEEGSGTLIVLFCFLLLFSLAFTPENSGVLWAGDARVSDGGCDAASMR